MDKPPIIKITPSEGATFYGVSFNTRDRTTRPFDREGFLQELKDQDTFSWIDIEAPDIESLNELLRQLDIDLVLVSNFFSPEILPRLGDRIQLQQVLLNLMMNAIEAMRGVDDGLPRELWVDSEEVESTNVLVAVRDSGPGLDAESLDRLFEIFYTTKPEGLGMGLAISRSIIEAHGRTAVGDGECATRRRRLSVHFANW